MPKRHRTKVESNSDDEGDDDPCNSADDGQADKAAEHHGGARAVTFMAVTARAVRKRSGTVYDLSSKPLLLLLAVWAPARHPDLVHLCHLQTGSSNGAQVKKSVCVCVCVCVRA